MLILEIAAGIVLGVLVLAILPFFGELLVGLAILAVGAALLIATLVLFKNLQDALAVAIFIVPIIAVFVLRSTIMKFGCFRNWLSYVCVSLSRASTADAVAARARRLQELRERAKALVETA